MGKLDCMVCKKDINISQDIYYVSSSDNEISYIEEHDQGENADNENNEGSAYIMTIVDLSDCENKDSYKRKEDDEGTNNSEPSESGDRSTDHLIV